MLYMNGVSFLQVITTSLTIYHKLLHILRLINNYLFHPHEFRHIFGIPSVPPEEIVPKVLIKDFWSENRTHDLLDQEPRH